MSQEVVLYKFQLNVFILIRMLLKTSLSFLPGDPLHGTQCPPRPERCHEAALPGGGESEHLGDVPFVPCGFQVAADPGQPRNQRPPLLAGPQVVSKHLGCLWLSTSPLYFTLRSRPQLHPPPFCNKLSAHPSKGGGGTRECNR